MRAFIAIDLPDDIRQALAGKMEEFRHTLGHADLPKSQRDSSIRWSRLEGIHLTLKFLGEIADTQVDRVTSALSALEPFEKFYIQVKGFGFFPGAARPRVFWAGINAPPALIQLAGRIEDKMEGLGFTHESRDYNPHLTLARFTSPRPQPTLRALVEEQKELSLGRFEVGSYFLFESKLSPEGSKYRKVVRFPQIARGLFAVENNQGATSESID
ncbi:MAG TPA: RNA 2',3'-cyclic phosphodiesterase [Terriglobia bacterium]|nr:RNA 2',3'-cyclic phosphodiesterase [Terriglobia bacterium]